LSTLARNPARQTRDGFGGTIEHIASRATLAEAWRRVRANKGGSGADGVTIEAFEMRLESNLDRLSCALLDGTYRPHALRRFTIQKSSGGVRRLAVPSVVDRVAQTAAVLALDSRLEERQSRTSHGYRRGRGVATAIADLVAALAGGRWFVVDLDISAYFDSVPHRRLLAELAIWIDDPAVVRLVALWLRSFSAWGRGVSQGAPIAPLLANLYLHPIDGLLAAAGLAAVRYADDIAIACCSNAEAQSALGLAQRLLRERGLRANVSKTAIHPPGATFDYLGARIAIGQPQTALSASRQSRHRPQEP
jgi:CRISPR-associated protein Cas1